MASDRERSLEVVMEAIIRDIVHQEIGERVDPRLNDLIGRFNALEKAVKHLAGGTRAVDGFASPTPPFLKGPGTAWNDGYRQALRDVVVAQERSEAGGNLEATTTIVFRVANLHGIDLTDTPEEAAK